MIIMQFLRVKSQTKHESNLKPPEIKLALVPPPDLPVAFHGLAETDEYRAAYEKPTITIAASK